MESWRQTWRKGFAPQLSDKALLALREALANDDPRLLQGATTSPPALQCIRDWPPEGACPIAFAGWQGEELGTLEKVECYFGNACCRTDQALEEPAACRWFINWFDESPRQEVFRELLGEVEFEMRRRKESMDATAGRTGAETLETGATKSDTK